MSVDDQDMIAVNDDSRVAIEHGGRLGNRTKYTRSNLLQVKKLGRGSWRGGSFSIVFNRANDRSPGKAACRSPKASARQSLKCLAAIEPGGLYKGVLARVDGSMVLHMVVVMAMSV